MILRSEPGWLAIDKPAETSAHNAESSGRDDAVALVEHLLATDTALREKVGPEVGFHPAPVHRLDVGTSGILVIACRKVTARELAQALESTKTEKVYLALCRAKPEPTEGTWTWPLSDRAEGRRDPQGKPPHKNATTRYRVLESSQYFSLIEVRIESGRTHQIRRHAALAKHPLVGDRRYGLNAAADRAKALYNWDRLALHHTKLAFTLLGQPVSLEAKLPEQMKRVLASSFVT